MRRNKLLLKNTRVYGCLFLIFFFISNPAWSDETSTSTAFKSNSEQCYSLCFSSKSALPPPSSPQLRVVAVQVGPIWGQMDANNKCPEVAKTSDAVWDGQWWTTVPGTMSVCELPYPLNGK